MDAPKPPFHSVTEELLYNIYLKLQMAPEALTEEEVNTLAKLNALLTDAELVSMVILANTIAELKGNVPEAGNTLEKLYNIIQGLTYLSAEDIDTLAELNAVLSDADLVRTTDMVSAITELKGNVPGAGDTLEKLYNLILSSKSRTVQFHFKSNQFADDEILFKGQITSLSHDFTHELSSVSYKSRLDTSDNWNQHTNLAALQTWITANITGNETNGTKYWIKCMATYKQGKSGEARNILHFQIPSS